MPKVSIQLLRSGILLFNISAMTLLGFVMYDLLLESPQDVPVRLVDPQDFELKEQAARPVPNQYREIIGELYRTAPQAPVAQIKPVESTLPLLDSGPIGEWEIVGVIYSPEGQRFASIQEKGQTNVLKSSSRSGRPVNTSRVRGRSTRGGGASAINRASSRTSGRSPTSNQRVRYLEQGKEFRIDENSYMVVEIKDQPKQVIYEHNGRSYTLRQESIIDPVIHEEGETLVLRGFSPEELELLTGGQTGASAVGRLSAIPEDVRGSIRGNDGKPMRGTEVPKSPTTRPTGVVPPRGVSPRTPTTKPNSRTIVVVLVIPGQTREGELHLRTRPSRNFVAEHPPRHPAQGWGRRLLKRRSEWMSSQTLRKRFVVSKNFSEPVNKTSQIRPDSHPEDDLRGALSWPCTQE
jgi:hypothetical protein